MCYDLVQKKHSILRNYPVLGHMRFLMEDIRPELQQYFIERNYDGRPFDRNTRSSIYQRAKGLKEEQPFGTERDVDEPGYEYLVHSTEPVDVRRGRAPREDRGTALHPAHSMALMNVSAMSFGALSANAIMALNSGARLGGFAHDTGEGGLSQYHRQGGDLVWEIGSGYFGARTEDGDFDPASSRHVRATTRSRWSPSSSAREPSPASAVCCPEPRSPARSPRPRRSGWREVRVPVVPPACSRRR